MVKLAMWLLRRKNPEDQFNAAIALLRRVCEDVEVITSTTELPVATWNCKTTMQTLYTIVQTFETGLVDDLSEDLRKRFHALSLKEKLSIVAATLTGEK